MPSNYLVQVHEGPQPHELRPDSWVEWLDKCPVDELRMIALNRHVRDRGGIREALEVSVYIADPKTPRYASGGPLRAHCTVFVLTPNPDESTYTRGGYEPNYARDHAKGAQGD